MNEKKVKWWLAGLFSVVSWFICFRFYGNGLSGSASVMMAVFVAAFTVGQLFFARDIKKNWIKGNHELSIFYGVVCTVLFVIIVTGEGLSWYLKPQEAASTVRNTDAIIASTKLEVDAAQKALNQCPEGRYTKCIKPATETLKLANEKYQKELKVKSAMKGDLATVDMWVSIAKPFGIAPEELRLKFYWCVSAIFEFVVLLFYIQAERDEDIDDINKSKSVSKEDKITEKTPKIDVLSDNIPTYQPTYQANPGSVADIGKKKSLMDILHHNRNYQVLGAGMGVGKTSMLGRLGIFKKNHGHQVIVFDPHYVKNIEIWHPDFKIIGSKSNYKAIESGLIDLVNLMRKRLEEYDSSNHYPITFIMDEMTTTCDEANASDYFKKLLTEGRKANIFFVGGGHSDRVGAMGLKGNGDLKAGFQAILGLTSKDGKSDFKVSVTEFDEKAKPIDAGVYDHPGSLDFTDMKQDEIQALLNEQYGNSQAAIDATQEDTQRVSNFTDTLTLNPDSKFRKTIQAEEAERVADIFRDMIFEHNNGGKKFSIRQFTLAAFNGTGDNYKAKAIRHLEAAGVDYSQVM